MASSPSTPTLLHHAGTTPLRSIASMSESALGALLSRARKAVGHDAVTAVLPQCDDVHNGNAGNTAGSAKGLIAGDPPVPDLLVSVLRALDAAGGSHACAPVSEAHVARVWETICAGVEGVGVAARALLRARASGGAEWAAERVAGVRAALKQWVFLLHRFVERDRSAGHHGGKRKAAAGRRKKRTRDGGAAAAAAAAAAATDPDADADSGASPWEAAAERERLLSHVVNLLELDLKWLWKGLLPDDDLLETLSKVLFVFVDAKGVLARPSLQGCLRLFAFHLAGRYEQSESHLTPGLLKRIRCAQADSLPAQIANLVAPPDVGAAGDVPTPAEDARRRTALASDMIDEIARMRDDELVSDPSARDSAKHLAAFLTAACRLLPAPFVCAKVPALLQHLDGEAHHMRSAVVDLLGDLCTRAGAGAGAPSAKDVGQYLDILEERMLDTSTWTRARVLQTWSVLAEKKVVPLARFCRVAALAVERVHDKSGHVRKNAVQLLCDMLACNPFRPFLSLREIERDIGEKKAAMQALVVGGNEGGASAEKEEAPGESTEEKKEEEEEEMMEVVEEKKAENEKRDDEGREEEKAEVDVEDSEEKGEKEGKGEKEENEAEKEERAEKKKEEEAVSAGDGDEDEVNRRLEVALQVDLACLEDTRNFVKVLHDALPAVALLLHKKSPGDLHIAGDVKKSVDFMVTAKKFRLDEADDAFREMLPLVWKTAATREAIVAAFHEVYVLRHRDAPPPRAAARQLTHLSRGATVGFLCTLDRVFAEIAQNPQKYPVADELVEALFARYCRRLPDGTSAAALRILGSLQHAPMSEERMRMLLRVGLAPGRLATHAGCDLAQATVAALRAPFDRTADATPPVPTARRSGSSPGGGGGGGGGSGDSSSSTLSRLSCSHYAVVRLADLLRNGSASLPLVREIVDALFQMARHPDKLAAHIITDLAEPLFSSSSAPEKENNPPSGEDGPEAGPESGGAKADAAQLTRFVFLVGHVALRQLAFVDEVKRELKRQRELKTPPRPGRRGGGGSPGVSPSTAGTKKRAARSRRGRVRRSGASEDSGGSPAPSAAAEVGVLGGEGQHEDDLQLESVGLQAEDEILDSANLLGKLAPIVARVCVPGDPDWAAHPELRTAAVLSLCQLMLVSRRFCRAHLRLLFTVLETAAEPAVRRNIVFALGDLFVRFPNDLEPWTRNLFATLGDADAAVRRSAVMVVSHLVLNNRIKVKEHLSAMARRIVDEDPVIADAAKTFFDALAKKADVLYNSTPDVLSHLSVDAALPREGFDAVMAFILGHVTHDKHAEYLVDLMCKRLDAESEPETRRRIASALASVSCSALSLKKLVEHFRILVPFLSDPEVFSCFAQILVKARKRPEAACREHATELENKIEHALGRRASIAVAGSAAPAATAAGDGRGGDGGHGSAPAHATAGPRAGPRAGTRAGARAPRAAAGRRARGPQRRRAPQEWSSESESSDSDFDDDFDVVDDDDDKPLVLPPRRAPARAGLRSRK